MIIFKFFRDLVNTNYPYGKKKKKKKKKKNK